MRVGSLLAYLCFCLSLAAPGPAAVGEAVVFPFSGRMGACTSVLFLGVLLVVLRAWCTVIVLVVLLVVRLLFSESIV